MNTQKIRQYMSLVPLSVLETVIARHPHETVPTTKGEAVETVTKLIEFGYETLDSVRSTKPTRLDAALSKTTPATLPDAVVDAVVSATNDVNQAKGVVLELQSKVEDTFKSIFDTRVALTKSFDTLEQSLNDKVSALTGVDPVMIQSAIRNEVASLFDTFKQSSTPEEMAEIAKIVPKTERRTARDVFGDICQYTIDGEYVTFGDMTVDVWNDPECPAIVSDYVFQPKHLHQALIALDDPLPDNVWLAGERGTGKSEFVSQLANRLGRKLYRVNFDEAMERADFIGANTIENGNVVWKAGVIAQAIQHIGAIVLLDEISFARPQGIAALHALTERSPHRSIVIAETGDRLPVASHVVFFCADNSNGYGDTSGNFSGVRDQNTAFIDRFGFTLRFEYLNASDEAKLISSRSKLSLKACTMLVGFANTAREKARAGLLTQPPSLRQLFAWARAVSKGMPVAVAFENAIINKFPEDCEPELRGVFTATINAESFKQAIKGGV